MKSQQILAMIIITCNYFGTCVTAFLMCIPDAIEDFLPSLLAFRGDISEVPKVK